MRFLFRLASFAAIMASLAGLLVVVWPFWELANHFRPFVLLGVMLLAVLAFWLRQRNAGRLALGLAVLNALLLLPGLLNQAQGNGGRKVGQIKVLTFNIWIGNSHMDKVAQAIKKADADLVMLQEVTATQYKKLVVKLEAHYPYKATCASHKSCQLALFSKREFKQVRYISRGFDHPPLIDASLVGHSDPIRVLVTHISWPFHPAGQRRDMNWLAAYVKAIKAPLILGGDFNLSPWSWKMARFQGATGLFRHTTWMFSWPAGALPAFVQLDHVLSTASFRTVFTKVRQKAGSDHLPVLVSLHP